MVDHGRELRWLLLWDLPLEVVGISTSIIRATAVTIIDDNVRSPGGLQEGISAAHQWLTYFNDRSVFISAGLPPLVKEPDIIYKYQFR